MLFENRSYRPTAQNLRQWENKPSLRAVYQDLYRKMASECLPGATLEIGGGSGNFKRYRNDVVTSDVVSAPWLDLVADAEALPFKAGVFSNIVMFDVLHHIEFPRTFFAEAQRVLIPGGKMVMVEPAITPISWLFYRFVHQEPVNFSADPLSEGKASPSKDPYSANQAIPTLLVTRYAQRFALPRSACASCAVVKLVRISSNRWIQAVVADSSCARRPATSFGR